MSEEDREVMEGDILERADVPGPDKKEAGFEIIRGRRFGVREVNERSVLVDEIPNDPREKSRQLTIPKKFLKEPWINNKGGEGNPPVKPNREPRG